MVTRVRTFTPPHHPRYLRLYFDRKWVTVFRHFQLPTTVVVLVKLSPSDFTNLRSRLLPEECHSWETQWVKRWIPTQWTTQKAVIYEWYSATTECTDRVCITGEPKPMLIRDTSESESRIAVLNLTHQHPYTCTQKSMFDEHHTSTFVGK